jgi:pilus assembly protein CpaC
VLAQLRVTPVASVSAVDVAPEPIAISLLVGRSAIIDVGTPISRVSLTSADVADAMVTSSTQLLLNGKIPGTISMFVWERSGGIRRYEIAVQRDLASLDQQLKQLFPGEAIQAHSNGRQIVLSGTASNKEVLAKAVDVAAGFVEKRDEVVTLLQVPPGPRSNQVLLRVRFAEVSRSAMTELGLSLFTSPLGVRNTLGRLTTQQFAAPGFEQLEWTKEGADWSDFGAPVSSAKGKFTFSDFLNFFVFSERYDLGLLVRALQTRGLFESLAEPNLVAESGKEASFLAGGEFPIPIAQGSGANIGVSVQYKEYGIRLSFTPTVTGDRVHLKVRPEVSMLDFANAVTLGGFRIPALTTRRTETEIELRDGQTFAIAGLMNNSMASTLQKIPGIGDIPILGYLFRSKAAKKDQTELVVIITPQILANDSPGVTTQLPRLQEPFLPGLQDRESIPPPPPAFGAPTQSPGALNGTPGDPGVSLPPVQQLTADERATQQQLERAERAMRERTEQEERAARERTEQEERVARERTEQAERAARDRMEKEERARGEAEGRAQLAAAKLAAKQADEERRQQEVERRQQEKLAREQAKRDAEAAKQAAEVARSQAEEERKRQQALADAEAKLRAAQEAYEAQRDRSGRQ